MRTPRNAAVNQAAALRSTASTVQTDNTTMKALYETLIDYKEENTGRSLISLFMSLPSRKDYPDYYEYIKMPIAMNTIHEKLERNKYLNEEALMDDFRLMFNNCKSYNEDGSQIYNDAVTLESVLNKRWKMFERAQETALAEQQILDHHHHHHHHNHNHHQAIHNSSNNNNINNSSSNIIKNNIINNQHNITSGNHHHLQQHNLNYHNNQHHHRSSHPQSQHQLTPSPQQLLQNGKMTGSNTATTINNTTAASNVATSAATTNIVAGAAATITTTASLPSPHQLASSIDPSCTLIQDSNMSFDGSNTSSTLNSQLNSAPISLNGINSNHLNNIITNHVAIAPKETSNMSTSDTAPATPTPHHTPGTRRHRNTDAPKRQLLTGYIIYASEIRKRVIDKNPDQSFGDISRLVGTEWKMLPHEIKSKYEQRALAHNAKVREKAIADAAERELNGITIDPNPVHTPKLSKRKAAQLAKEQLRQHGLNQHNNSLGGADTSMSGLTPNSSQSHQSGQDCTQSNSNHHQIHGTQPGGSSSLTPHSHAHQQQGHHIMMQGQTSQAFHQQQQKAPTTSVGIQTNAPTLRFVDPPPKKRLVYSETFRNYMEQLRPDCLHVSKWQKIKQMKSTSEHVNEDHFSTKTLANGIGKHESTAAALWALRDYMLKDSLNIANDCDFEY